MTQLSLLPQRLGAGASSSSSGSWFVVQSLQEFLIQEESDSRARLAKSVTAALPAAAAATVASPVQATATRRASSIALAGLSASPSNVNQSIKRRLSVAQMSKTTSSSSSGTNEEDTFEMRRIWRFCDSMIAAFSEEAVVDSFL
jgi:hypothetical protein